MVHGVAEESDTTERLNPHHYIYHYFPSSTPLTFSLLTLRSLQLILPWTWSFSIRTFQTDKGLTWEREKGIQTSKPEFPAFLSFPVTKIAEAHLLEQRVPWRFSDEHGTLLGSCAMGKTLLSWWHIWSVGRSLTSFPEAVFQTQGCLVMGPRGCLGGLRSDFGFHSLLPCCEHLVLCGVHSAHSRHLPTYLVIPPCLLSRTHQRPCLLKVKKGEKRKEKNFASFPLSLF